jgi:four helix bundle protein
LDQNYLETANLGEGDMQDFKGLKVWEEAHVLTVDVYRATAGFPRSEAFGLTSQLRRSSASIPANIAEGCGRRSRNEFAQSL